MAPFEPGPLIERLVDAGVEFVIVGGFAVIAHGYVRATKDLDIVPAPTRDNYERLAALLRGLDAEQIGVDAHLLPNQPTDPVGLGEGGSFQLTTSLGRLDILQESDDVPAYRHLASGSATAHFRGRDVRVCSIAELVRMKRRAGRPQDVADLAALEAAHGAIDPAPDGDIR
jgi:hypothetical protein